MRRLLSRPILIGLKSTGAARHASRVLLAVVAGLALGQIADRVGFGIAVASEAQRPGSGELQPARRDADGPPPLLASNFADEFVITGAEQGPGDHYVPAHGDGTFGPISGIAGLPIVNGVDVADVDGDGDLDFLIAEGASGHVYLYANQGAGVFLPARVASGISTAFSTNLRIADFNGDGRPDFVVGDARTELGIKVFLQNPAGRFRRSAVLDLAWNDAPSTGDTGPTMMGVATGDFDGDGLVDIALLGYEGEGAGEVRLYRGNGRGRFGAPVLLFDIEDAFGVNLFATGLAAFDLEGDGDLDLAVGAANGQILLYTNSGTGQFTAPADAAFVLEGQSGIDAYDADGDGDHDLVIVVGASQRLYYVENLGGTLAQPAMIAALGGFGIAVGAPPLTGAEAPARRGKGPGLR